MACSNSVVSSPLSPDQLEVIHSSRGVMPMPQQGPDTPPTRVGYLDVSNIISDTSVISPCENRTTNPARVVLSWSPSCAAPFGNPVSTRDRSSRRSAGLRSPDAVGSGDSRWDGVCHPWSNSGMAWSIVDLHPAAHQSIGCRFLSDCYKKRRTNRTAALLKAVWNHREKWSPPHSSAPVESSEQTLSSQQDERDAGRSDQQVVSHENPC